MAHFAIENLSFTYPEAKQPTLNKINLRIKHGSYVCLCGQSGCGKTTLLRHLKSVLTPAGKTEGVVLFNDRPLAEISERDQSILIGFVMQNPDAQIVIDKVWHELAFGLESLGYDQRTMRLRVAEMASYFGIQNWFHKDVRDLSGGQKQLLNLASIMAMQPSVLILDEPTSQLDPIAAADFLNTVRKINLELGTTVIITEHRLEDVFAVADQVIVMDKGSITADGAPLLVAEQLYAKDDPMTYALPAPVRIYYGVEGEVDSVSLFAESMSSRSDSPGSHESATGTFGSCGTRFVDTLSANIHSSSPQENPSLYTACPLTVREGRTWLTDWVFAHPSVQTALPEEPLYDLETTEAALEMSEVWFRYDRQAPDVLRGVNLHVPKGETFALVGGNGTGKSTLLKCACSVLKPYRGTIRIFGKKLKDWKGDSLFQGTVAMLPQDPQNLFVKKTVREDLQEMISGQRLSREECDQRIQEVAKTCAISQLMDSHPFDLSGGEQQRAALAKVLLTDPQLLLLDEPTKGIDSFFKRELARIFDRLKTKGVTILMVSHDVEFCARFADTVSMFFDGSVITTNTPHRFFAQNSFYTTAANRMSRNVFANAVTDEDVIELCTTGLVLS